MNLIPIDTKRVKKVGETFKIDGWDENDKGCFWITNQGDMFFVPKEETSDDT